MTTPIGSSLPSSGAPSLGAVDDEMSTIYASFSELRQGDMALGASRVDEDQAASKQARAQEQAAIKQEEANQATSGRGFLSSVGHLIGDIASDVVHGHIGRAVDDAGRDLRDAWNSPSFWHDLETGLEGVAIVAATVATAGVGGAALGAVAVGVGVAAGTGAGLAEARTEHFSAAAEDASADATDAQHRIEQLQRSTTDVLSDAKRADESLGTAQQTLTQAEQTNDRTFVTAASTTMKG